MPDSLDRSQAIVRLNERLPKKRAIGHALIRDLQDRVLLCQLTYKSAWDLPGGVIEPGESPQHGTVREVQEELGLDVGRTPPLVAVNWLAPWNGWDDATVFLFDCGRYEADIVSRMTLQPREIAAVHWCDPEQVAQHAAVATARLLSAIHDLTPADGPHYFENGVRPGADGGTTLNTP